MLEGREGEVRSAAFSSDGKRILTASLDKTMRLWDAATGQPIGEPIKEPAKCTFGAALEAGLKEDMKRLKKKIKWLKDQPQASRNPSFPRYYT